jgi:hypothetical protein
MGFNQLALMRQLYMELEQLRALLLSTPPGPDPPRGLGRRPNQLYPPPR